MPLKLAIIGTGKVAREQYIPFLAAQPDVSLAYYNRTPQTAQQVAEKFPGQLLPTLAAAAQWNPTAVLVLTSETARFEVAKTLIDLGVGKLFFEKPLVAAAGQAHVTEADFEQAKSLLSLARARHCETAMVFNYRFFDQTKAAKAAVESRRLGNVTNITGLVHFACWSHCIDLIRHFAGDIAEVTALAGVLPRASPQLKMQAADVAAAFLTTTAATGIIIGTTAMQWQHPLYELTFTFERGRLHMRDLDGTLEILDGNSQAHETIALVRDRSRWDQYSASFKKSLAAYLQSLRDSASPPIPGIDGLLELQFEAALKRSIAQRRPIRLQEEFPIDL